MSSKNIVEAVERDRIRPLEIIRSVEGAMESEGLENARVNQPPERSVSDLLQDCAKHDVVRIRVVIDHSWLSHGWHSPHEVKTSRGSKGRI